ncbi:MAG TPA: ATP-grasp domain-containing protein, partial [Micromonosporaceae bacterium]
MTDLVVLVGSGLEVYRGYLLRSLAREHRVWLLADREPSWETPYLVGHTSLDTSDVDAMAAAAGPLAPAGVLTWDDNRVVQVARLAQVLGLPGCAPEAALRCRDKHATRSALAAAGVPQARSTMVASLGQARQVAAGFGYPVVLKARALNASIGVVLVEHPDQLAARFRIVRGATSPGATEVAPGDVLVEEYLDGPEISVDAAWQDGRMSLAFVAHKQVGYPPSFEEIGHLVDAADPLLRDTALADLLVTAHAAVGFHTGWTHTEVRLTAAGPKLVEINARLGGDLIPRLAELAMGIQAAPIVAAIACGHAPVVVATRSRVAAIRFLYPPHDSIARAVRVDHA